MFYFQYNRKLPKALFWYLMHASHLRIKWSQFKLNIVCRKYSSSTEEIEKMSEIIRLMLNLTINRLICLNRFNAGQGRQKGHLLPCEKEVLVCFL